MHKDLSEVDRTVLEDAVADIVQELFADGQSLAIARECLINAFDRAAEELGNA